MRQAMACLLQRVEATEDVIAFVVATPLLTRDGRPLSWKSPTSE
jgi:hypothetical protein